MVSNVRWFSDLGLADLEQVGGKNSSLGEMVSHLANLGVRVPDGFATTADAYRRFIGDTGLAEKISARLAGLDTDDVRELARAGEEIRAAVVDQPFPADLEAEVRSAYAELAGPDGQASFAVRSSATAEDLPDASFAGQQETFLNVRGIEAVLTAIREVFASLYNDRAIAYRVHHDFDHDAVALSAGVQQMVRSDVGTSGVMFTMDTESGFSDAVFITSSYGLGEAVVQGAVNPDEFYVYKPSLRAGRPAILKRSIGAKAIKMVYTASRVVGETTAFVDVDEAARGLLSLTDAQVEELARQALVIEDHYGRPMDIEWGLDGLDGELYILQARPETVQSRVTAGSIQRYRISDPGPLLVEGRAIGQRIGAGAVRVLSSVEDMHEFVPGEVLVADMTDPDWEPIMKRASAIVTNRGGRTCHAAIIARELGIPAVVGTGAATRELADGRPVTVSCAEGDTGYVYDGLAEFSVETTELDALPEIGVKIMMNVGTPDQAFAFSRTPNSGVGLARLEFIINRQIGIHPKALLDLDNLDEPLRSQIAATVGAYPSPRAYFVTRVAEGVATLAAAFAPEPVIVRMSDFKSNEYANLVGGELYEPHEENPMIGYRGASRYLSVDFADCFAMECEALAYVRDTMGLTNVKIMIPFVRTLTEAEGVIELLAKNGLRRGDNGLQVIMMCELPSNAVIADAFLDHFDGFSIGSNDMTQLTLGLDRDSALVAAGFDERDPAVKFMLSAAIKACKDRGKYVGICGQGPSDHPDLADWLLDQGIDTMSLNPDTVVATWLRLGGLDPSGAPERALPNWREPAVTTQSPTATRRGGRSGLRLLIMGPPGAGKGTQAELITSRYGIPAISTGDIFRSHVVAGTELGLRAQQIMASGGYIDDDITNAIVGSRLAEEDTRNGFLLDGYPRTVPQVDALDHLLAVQSVELTAVILLVAGSEDATKRLLLRADSQGRSDDTADAILRRQEVYQRETAPVLDLYRHRRCLVEVDALGPRDDVTHRILTALGNLRSVQL